MTKVVKLIKKHLARLLTYFKYGVISAVAEGINTKIRTTKEAYGFRNVEEFINLFYFHYAGLKLHPL